MQKLSQLTLLRNAKNSVKNFWNQRVIRADHHQNVAKLNGLLRVRHATPQKSVRICRQFLQLSAIYAESHNGKNSFKNSQIRIKIRMTSKN